MSSSLGSLYRAIIDDVLRNVREDFEEQGVDESILNELKRSWEIKVAQARVVQPFQLSDGSENIYGRPDTATDPATASGAGAPAALANETGAPFAAASLASLATSAHPSAEHGSTPVVTPGVEKSEASTPASMMAHLNGTSASDAPASSTPPVSTGNGDQNGGRGSRKARRLNDGRTEALGGADDDEDEDAINSDLDDSDEDAESGEGDDDITNIILCQYEKARFVHVARTKNKWKCVLKDGVLTMDGRDYVFHRASGDFEW
ncbi:transcription factor IIA, alpha/beta subunit-domain-containing protein [Thamnocephalis sphaerospora]|uniref:Transcription initiation factor IIA large subunit n=1 Tax=Thamnocephalis sphaerospora TaxID=78915 RepID=A0A4P9XLK5_9FUNG|nr:transcription factor IIA, alpha/beta subunit-domain-containing protein [Thamnocephalis sphaerospora]|eukprot:RKP06754.1 transcription factor IIA, alpha/beta subunit-domain-containing protein [Thamnocephalis sphaerospora]